MDPFKDYIDKSNGIFLLILALCGNFIAETLSCQIQKQLTNNRLLKYLVVYFTIYFSITITSHRNENPFKLLVTAFIIWIIFIFFTRMGPQPTIIAIISLMIIYFINNYIDYQSEIDENSEKTNSNLRNIQKGLLLLVIGSIIVGNYYYIQKKIGQYGEKFRYSTYIFGVNKCHSLSKIK